MIPVTGWRAPADLLRPLALLILSACASVWLGKDLNWDQLNYHAYVVHAMLAGRQELDFMAASVQSYLNPLAHVPFYLLASSSLSSAAASALLGAFHGLNFVLVYAICKTILPPGGQRNNLALLFTAISALHPVVAGELGSSLAELVASLPVLGGILLLLKLMGQDEASYRRLRNGQLAGAFVLLGAGAALKLPFALFGVACLPALLVRERSARTLLTALLVAGSGLALGCLIAGGFQFLAMWQKFGNPFFPFFNHIFMSPDYPPVKLVNDRFVQHSLLQIVTFPFRMLLPADFVTTERLALDPRYAVIIVAAVLVGVRKLMGKAGANSTAAMPIAALLIAFTCAFPLWAISSGNGRYGLPLHLLCGPVLAGLLSMLTIDTDRLMRCATIGAGVALLILGVTLDATQFTRVPHTAHWYDVAIPARAKVDGALYLSAGHFDRSSNAYLVASFPPHARFASLNGYINFAAGRWGGKRLEQMIAAQGDRPIFLLAEGSPPAEARERAAWARRYDLNLGGFGLELAGLENCDGVSERYAGDTAKPFAAVCPLRRRPPHEYRTEKVAVDGAFDRLEKARPALFYPAAELSYFRADAYCRFYSATEYYLCERQGRLTAFQVAPTTTIDLGSMTPR